MIFAFINLVLLIGLFIYIFKYYLIDSLDISIDEQKAYLSKLEQEHKNLQQIEFKIDKSIEYQDKYISELKNKVLLWQNVAQNQKILAKEEKLNQLEQIKQRRETQEQFFLFAKAQRLATPLIKNKLENELKLYFANRENAYEYIDRIEGHIKQ